jgi:DAK2 domain fusion protein YloV
MRTLDGIKFSSMVIQGSNNLSLNAKIVDALNVFPVPDGDTGTNMNLSMTSGAKEVKNCDQSHLGKVAQCLSKGLLMGARGNSGVILSQLFRGFAKSVEGKEVIDTTDFAQALEAGVLTAYKAVMKPVEGTILTVAKDTATKALLIAQTEKDFIKFLELVVKESNASLKRTPDLLPILKEVGVVDSGGQGLVCIYEGFLANLKGEEIIDNIEVLTKEETNFANSAQAHMKTEDIEFGYCTEFMIKLSADSVKEHPFNETSFRDEISSFGDSLLVVADDELVKVHIHAEYPGEVLTRAQRFGSLINMKIENMREQHSSLLFDDTISSKLDNLTEEIKQPSEFAIVAVAMGSGIADLFIGSGATEVIEGGQTMNPSTEDILNAVNKTNAKNVFILPNNKNIILAARQAKDVSDVNIVVIESKTIPQGLAATLAFNPSRDVDQNENAMVAAIGLVNTGQITYAVRDTQIDGVDIKKDDYMGLVEGKIVSTDQNKFEATKGLLDKLITDEHEIFTIFVGEEATDIEVNDIISYVENKFPDIEIETYNGNQPLYSFIFSAE